MPMMGELWSVDTHYVSITEGNIALIITDASPPNSKGTHYVSCLVGGRLWPYFRVRWLEARLFDVLI